MRSFSITLALTLVTLVLVPTAAASDGDSDLVEDDRDNCTGTANPLQFDADGDGVGDLCEEEFPVSDDFAGTPGVDLMFGGFRDSLLSGAGDRDSLYGEAGDDRIDGGPGPDFLAGGPGNDTLTGGPNCDVFGLEIGIEQRDVITDFSPVNDRVRFPPRFREQARDRPPRVDFVTTDRGIELTLIAEDAPLATVVFDGLPAGVPIVISTAPCGDGPPPPGICPQRGAHRSHLFLGFSDLFCPEDGELRILTGIYRTARFGGETGKQLRSPDDA